MQSLPAFLMFDLALDKSLEHKFSMKSESENDMVRKPSSRLFKRKT